MDHSAHSSGHSMPMDPGMEHDMCSMNMLFTWDWRNSCVVFKWWHVKTFSQFLLSFLLIVVLSMGYEFSRFLYIKKGNRFNLLHNHSNTYDSITNNEVSITQPNSGSFTQLRSIKIKKSLFYGWQVGYSFMLMLVFMTYNGWYMIAVVIGAALGNYLWGQAGDEVKSMSCH